MKKFFLRKTCDILQQKLDIYMTSNLIETNKVVFDSAAVYYLKVKYNNYLFS